MKFFSQNHTDPPSHKKIGETSSSGYLTDFTICIKFHKKRNFKARDVRKTGAYFLYVRILSTSVTQKLPFYGILHHTAHTWIHRWHRRGLLFLVC